jgi:hypothetical protein
MPSPSGRGGPLLTAGGFLLQVHCAWGLSHFGQIPPMLSKSMSRCVIVLFRCVLGPLDLLGHDHEHIASPDDDGFSKLDPAVFTDDGGSQVTDPLQRLRVGSMDDDSLSCSDAFEVEPGNLSSLGKAKREPGFMVECEHDRAFLVGRISEGILPQPRCSVRPGHSAQLS